MDPYVLDYLGIVIDFSVQGKVMFTMFDYLEVIVVECESKGWTKEAVWSAHKHLFEVRDEAANLNDKDAEFFHRITARLFYAGKRARPDIQLAISFLYTRVKSPDVDDMNKLKRVLEYIRTTIFIPLVLGWDKTGNLVWSIDVSFAVQMDMKSQTGFGLSLGLGAVTSSSLKQKLTISSTTTSELYGIHDGMPMITWF